MKLIKYEGYNLTIEPELLTLKPFKNIWNRDRTATKSKALSELAFIYFFCDPRSDYQYIVLPEQRALQIIEDQGMPKDWAPDKNVEEAMEFYTGFKTISELLLEDSRYLINNFRMRLRSLNMEELEPKELKDIGALIKQVPSMMKDLDEAEKNLAKELAQNSRMRGQSEKTLGDDGFNFGDD